MKKILLVFALMTSFFFLTACEKIAILTTPSKKPQISHTPLAINAQRTFWQTLHHGQYDNIPEAEKLLTAAYLENSNDPTLAAHLGFLHIWKISERQRLSQPEPRIVNEIILARKYFSDAVALNNDPRYLGFLGDSTVVEGKIFNDQRQQTAGYFILKRAIHAWPQFNLFSAGYIMSTLPPTTKYYRQALNWQWRTLDLCAHHKIDRHNPTYRPYLSLETQQGGDRACWNSWIAPYNFEGFFLNMGDMLVKAGDWATGIKIYNNAKLASNYTTWPFREVLEERIQNAPKNVRIFNKLKNINDFPLPNQTVMMVDARFSCMACHQQAGDPAG